MSVGPSHSRLLAVTLGVLMAAACAVPGATTAGASPTTSPGPTTSPTTLTTGYTLSGYDVATSSSGTAYIGWIRTLRSPTEPPGRFICARSSRARTHAPAGCRLRTRSATPPPRDCACWCTPRAGSLSCGSMKTCRAVTSVPPPRLRPASFSRRSMSAALPRTASCWTLRSPPTAACGPWQGHPMATACRSVPVAARPRPT